MSTCLAIFSSRIRVTLTVRVDLLLETEYILCCRAESDNHAQVKASLTPVLQAVKGRVLEFEQLIQWVVTSCKRNFA